MRSDTLRRILSLATKTDHLAKMIEFDADHGMCWYFIAGKYHTIQVSFPTKVEGSGQFSAMREHVLSRLPSSGDVQIRRDNLRFWVGRQHAVVHRDFARDRMKLENTVHEGTIGISHAEFGHLGSFVRSRFRQEKKQGQRRMVLVSKQSALAIGIKAFVKLDVESEVPHSVFLDIAPEVCDIIHKLHGEQIHYTLDDTGKLMIGLFTDGVWVELTHVNLDTNINCYVETSSRVIDCCVQECVSMSIEDFETMTRQANGFFEGVAILEEHNGAFRIVPYSSHEYKTVKSTDEMGFDPNSTIVTVAPGVRWDLATTVDMMNWLRHESAYRPDQILSVCRGVDRAIHIYKMAIGKRTAVMAGLK